LASSGGLSEALFRAPPSNTVVQHAPEAFLQPVCTLKTTVPWALSRLASTSCDFRTATMLARYVNRPRGAASVPYRSIIVPVRMQALAASRGRDARATALLAGHLSIDSRSLSTAERLCYLSNSFKRMLGRIAYRILCPPWRPDRFCRPLPSPEACRTPKERGRG